MLTLSLVAVVLSVVPVLADDDDDDDDHERAGLAAAIKSGEIMTLSDILAAVRPRLRGRIVEIEFDREDGVPVYEIYVLRDDGRRLEYEIDARNATILSLENDD
ncbi:PepSY domain-containing protein [uncultured Hoeflea sp.]|uniref:PepSY domain-containing protein n=1 Tax=uncultured Hoeflea sp. TaxID=538666 RepID=UPI002602BDA5|nr:PepSY domain-containing protein [uncultured Hoeflea sp.]